MKDKNFSEQEIKRKVFSFIEERKLIQEGDRVIAGISGGGDSVCLFWMLLAYRSRCPFSFAVAHINHGVREEAAEDADFVKRLCGEHQVPFFLYEGNIREIARREKYSEEDAGRRLRYQSFEDAAAAFGANKIAVAHNENDRAETMLFHLFRAFCAAAGQQGQPHHQRQKRRNKAVPCSFIHQIILLTTLGQLPLCGKAAMAYCLYITARKSVRCKTRPRK